MNQSEIRLKCLELAMRRDKSVAEVVEDAKTLEAYATGEQKQAAPQEARATLGLPGRPGTQKR